MDRQEWTTPNADPGYPRADRESREAQDQALSRSVRPIVIFQGKAWLFFLAIMSICVSVRGSGVDSVRTP